MPRTAQPSQVIYTAKSQFWWGDLFFKPIEMGGRAIEEDDPILRSEIKIHFEPYNPRTRRYGIGQGSDQKP
jgi:hypothetical protein